VRCAATIPKEGSLNVVLSLVAAIQTNILILNTTTTYMRSGSYVEKTAAKAADKKE
jgi:hypothetical protein